MEIMLQKSEKACAHKISTIHDSTVLVLHILMYRAQTLFHKCRINQITC